MLQNFLKTTFRFLFKNKVFSFINILGLSLGILCCLYIVLYVQDQHRYDKHHRNAADASQAIKTATANPVTSLRAQ